MDWSIGYVLIWGRIRSLCFELNFLYFLCLFPKKITRFLDLLKIGLVASRAVHGSGRVGFRPSLDLPVGVGWMAEGPKTNRQHQLVMSISGLGSVRSVQRVVGFYKRHRNLQKLNTFASKIAEISLDLLESRQISPNMVKLSPKSAWISLNLARFHQVWSRSRRNKLGSPRISPNMVKVLPDLLESELDLAGVVGFVYYTSRVECRGFWRRKPATRPVGVKSWARKPVIDRRERQFGLKSG